MKFSSFLEKQSWALDTSLILLAWLTHICRFACWLLSADPAKEAWLCRRGRCCLDYAPASRVEWFVFVSGIAELLIQNSQQCHCCVTVSEVFLWHPGRTNVSFMTALFRKKSSTVICTVNHFSHFCFLCSGSNTFLTGTCCYLSIFNCLLSFPRAAVLCLTQH